MFSDFSQGQGQKKSTLPILWKESTPIKNYQQNLPALMKPTPADVSTKKERFGCKYRNRWVAFIVEVSEQVKLLNISLSSLLEKGLRFVFETSYVMVLQKFSLI